MVAVRDRAEPVGAGAGLPARDAPPGRVWRLAPLLAGTPSRPGRPAQLSAPQSATGVVLLVQEGRVRLLSDDGRGRVFLLSPSAMIEPQDLARLPGRRVRISYHAAPKLMAGAIDAIEILA